jgi:hypothetical protein
LREPLKILIDGQTGCLPAALVILGDDQVDYVAR